ncbi:MAG TPA: thrombospondin type 3 repeat-containing protein [Labilithrix sp.]|nr:thrombospondin type 3 repeat-containing protein [Labilithrix sp.]
MRLLPFAIVLGVSTLALPARATPTFPDVIEEKLGLTTQLRCSLCHAGTPSRGTVSTPFGRAMRSRGMEAYDENSVRVAIDALTAEKKDSDGDGVSDVDELKEGTDPNATAGEERVIPEYGCASTSRTAGTSSPTVIFLPALALAAFVRRTRRHRRSAAVLTLR